MQQAVFMAHCPYELGDIVEVAIIEGMAITGYPRRLGTAEMQITDIITEHSLKNGTVSFIYELDGKKRMRLIHRQGCRNAYARKRGRGCRPIRCIQ